MVRNRHHDVGMAGVRPRGHAARRRHQPATAHAGRRRALPTEDVGRIGNRGSLAKCIG